ncbi:MAG: PDZ domain-containing protein, partial [Verrucomicrobiae bacterium]|nr:PDZ domain-containing protein [Verrucomicrobiae bacterium]
DTGFGKALRDLPEFRLFTEKLPSPPWWGERRPSAYLGVQLGSVDAALASQLGLAEDVGALVNMVVEGSPADKAGIKKHDVIEEIDGAKVKGPDDVVKRISERKKGDKIKLGLFRAGKKIELEAELGEKPSPFPEPKRLRDALKSFRQLDYRLVPKVRVFTWPGEGKHEEIVIRLETDEDEKVGFSESDRESEPGPHGQRGIKRGANPSFPDAQPKPPTRAPLHQFKRVIVVKTDKDTTTVREENGKRFVTVRDAKDNVVFEGIVDSKKDLGKLPPDVRERLEKIERQIELREEDMLDSQVRELRVPLPSARGNEI